MDNLSRLLSLFTPACSVNLHCRFAGRWDVDHPQQAAGIVPWHVILRGETRLIVEGKTFDVRAGDIILFPHGSPHLLQSLVDWGQVVPAQVNNNGIVTDVWTEGPGPAVEVLCGEFHFGPGYRWMFADETVLIHLRADEQHDCPELETLLVMLVRESLGGLPGGASIVKGLADTLLALIL
ncbi:cupin domain-containing protein, partial [Enterobacter hormaechei]